MPLLNNGWWTAGTNFTTTSTMLWNPTPTWQVAPFVASPAPSPPTPEDDVSWLYRRVKEITTLAPKVKH